MKSNIKTLRSNILWVLVSLATVTGAHAVFAAKEVREEFHQTYPLDHAGKVQLENVNGTVRIVNLFDGRVVEDTAVRN